MVSILIATCFMLQFCESETKFNDKIKCHRGTIKNDLPSADGKQDFKEKSIFFIETSCKRGIDSRQACSIESAAKAHPKWEINVLFAGPVPPRSRKTNPISILKKYKNVNFFRIHVAKYGSGTPLRSRLASGILSRSQWRVHHTSDVLRFLTLYKWGGVYLDLDVVVVKPFDKLSKNWVAKENDAFIGSAFLAMSRDNIGRRFANAAIRQLSNHFSFDHFTAIGPAILERVMKEICLPSNVERMSAKTCSGITVYGEQYFFPVHYRNWQYYFKSGSLNLRPGKAYAHHMWNFISNTATVQKKSPFSKLAQKYCPKIYKIYRNTNWTI